MDQPQMNDRVIAEIVAQAYNVKTKRNDPKITVVVQDAAWAVVRASDDWGHWYFAVEPEGKSLKTMMLLSILPDARHIEADRRFIEIATKHEKAAEYDIDRWDSIVAEWAHGPEAFWSFFGSPDPSEGANDIWVKDFDPWGMQTFFRQMRMVAARKSPEPINLFISSPGGNPLSMLAMADFSRMIAAPIRTIAIDRAVSCGAFMLAIAGSPGMRYALPSATIMIHGVSAGTIGKIPDMEGDVDFFNDLENTILMQLAERSKLSFEQWKNKVRGLEDGGKRELWLNSKQALELGVIDEIISPDSFRGIFRI